MARTALARSAGRPALAAVGALALAHIVLRGQGWAYEWQWAGYQYEFLTILLGPLVAGIAAWEGLRWGRAADLGATAGRPVAVLAVAAGALWAWVALGYLLGFAVVVGIVKQHGTPGWPGAAALVTIGPALALLACCIAFGVLCGTRVRHPVVAPATSVITFAGLIAAYLVLPERVARVGGASASLVGLRVRPQVHLAQMALFGGLAVALLVIAAVGRLPRSDVPRTASVVALAAAVAGVGLMAQTGPRVFRSVPIRQRCIGAAPSLCLASGYVQLEGRLRTRLQPTLAAFDAIGLDRPRRLSQVVGARRVSGDGSLDPTGLLRYGTRIGPGIVMSAYLDRSCNYGSHHLFEAQRRFYGYLDAAVAHGVDPALVRAAAPQLRADFAAISACKAP